jgi:hypothetical protein
MRSRPSDHVQAIINGGENREKYLHPLCSWCQPPAGAEPKARGFPGFNVSTMSIPRITELLRLPAFEYAPQQPFAWPPTLR